MQGIRASRPLEILHVDATILRPKDNSKAYIHLIQDNFSRALLGVVVSQKCLAQNTFDNLKNVWGKYLKDSGKPFTVVLSDDGSENKGVVKDLISGLENPKLIHKIAQSIDCVFSNSMIEAANKQLKYHFLYHYDIECFEKLLPIVSKAIEDFNFRPHDVLFGWSPFEVLYGQKPTKQDYSYHIKQAKADRIARNRANSVCYTNYL